MKGQSPDPNQPSFLSQMLRDQLNPKHPLYILSEKMPWTEIEKEFSVFYSNTGKPGSPIRLMVALLILKQRYNFTRKQIDKN